MKKKLIPFLVVIIGLIYFLTACGGNTGPRQADYYWHDLYPHGILTEEEKEQRESVKQLAVNSFPNEMQGSISYISLKKQYIEVFISYSDNRVKGAPADWNETLKSAKEISTGLHEVLQKNGYQSSVVYFKDSRQILLTAKDGELLYNRFKVRQMPEAKAPVEIGHDAELDRLSAELEERIATLEAEGAFDPASPSYIVYVSSKSHTIHSISDCSGMKNYTAMSREEAENMGCKYCPNCW